MVFALPFIMNGFLILIDHQILTPTKIKKQLLPSLLLSHLTYADLVLCQSLESVSIVG